MKKNNRKGFTLAELLIVVAIIAVLIAIAVPIFVTALQKAEDAVIDANERSLKGMAVVEILSNDKLLYTEDDDTKTLNKNWYAIGKVKDDGTIVVTGSWVVVDTEKGGIPEGSESKKITESGYKYQIAVTIEATDLPTVPGT